MVKVPPELFELVCLVAHLAGCLYAEYVGGLRHPLRAYTHYLSLCQTPRTRPRSLPPSFQLLVRLRDDSGIVIVKHSPKQRRQGWFSGGCFRLPPFLSQMHQSVHDIYFRLETRIGRVKMIYRRGANTHPRQSPRSTANLPEHTPRRAARMSSWI